MTVTTKNNIKLILIYVLYLGTWPLSMFVLMFYCLWTGKFPFIEIED